MNNLLWCGGAAVVSLVLGLVANAYDAFATPGGHLLWFALCFFVGVAAGGLQVVTRGR